MSRPSFPITPTDQRPAIDLAIAVLREMPMVFVRGHQLCDLVPGQSAPGDDGHLAPSPRLVPMQRARLTELLSAGAIWLVQHGSKEPAPVPPPRWLVEGVLARGVFRGVRPVSAIVRAPFIRSDGSMVAEAGYDEATGVWFDPVQRFEVDLPEPTLAAATQARELLLDLVRDFPFEGDTDRAGWLSAVLTPFARHACAGPVPIFMVNANVPGAGKGLLLDIVGVIATGRPLPRSTFPDEDPELRKVITSKAIEAADMVLFDNVSCAIGGDSLEAALTAPVWSDRLLGVSKTIEVPMRIVWFCTGNGLQLRGDMPRRALLITLKSHHERPEDREDLTRPDLLAYVRGQRPHLVVAVLTMLTAYIEAGRPAVGLKPWGSFNEWSELVRAAIVWSGGVDPAGARASATVQAQEELARALLLVAWKFEVDPDGTGVSVKDALDRLDRAPADYPRFSEALSLLIETPVGKVPSVRQFARLLGQMKDRVIDGRRFETSKDRSHDGGGRWRVLQSL